jgi:hypothetical protein
MPGVQEETFSPTTGNVQDTIDLVPAVESDATPAARPTRLRRARTNIGNSLRNDDTDDGDEYDARLVDLLDTVGMWNSNWRR